MAGQQAAYGFGVLLGMLCGLTIGALVGSLIGAIILRAACSLFNKIAGPGDGVPEPSFTKALGIALVGLVAQLVVAFGIGIVLGLGSGVGAMSPRTAQVLASVCSTPASLAVLAALLMQFLPTTFGRGLTIAVLYLLVAIAVAVVIGLVVGGVIAVFFFAMR